MGMYTAFHFNAELKKNTPDAVINVLLSMTGGIGDPGGLDHPFFLTDRWRFLFTTDSVYFPAITHAEVAQEYTDSAWFVSVTSNLKNYGDEIDKFLDWIQPYVEARDGDFLGYSMYEEADGPELIYYSVKGAK